MTDTNVYAILKFYKCILYYTLLFVTCIRSQAIKLELMNPANWALNLLLYDDHKKQQKQRKYLRRKRDR